MKKIVKRNKFYPFRFNKIEKKNLDIKCQIPEKNKNYEEGR